MVQSRPKGQEISPVFRLLMTGKLCQPSDKWVPIYEPGKDKAVKGERLAPALICFAQDTVGL